MEYENNQLESDNINSLWMKNVFESLKNLEIMERNAREGCASLMDYIQMPMEYRMTQVADVQYKNLKFMVTEFDLLIKKLNPILEETDTKKLREINLRLIKIINSRHLFVKEVRRRDGMIHTQTTSAFDETLNLLSSQIFNIIKKIEHLLYIKEGEKKRW